MKIAPGQKQHLNNLGAQRVHERMNLEIYKEQARQQTKELTE